MVPIYSSQRISFQINKLVPYNPLRNAFSSDYYDRHEARDNLKQRKPMSTSGVALYNSCLL